MSNRARKRRRKRGEVTPTPTGPDRRLGFNRVHALLLGGGAVVAVAGFWVLSTGSISLAPALLVLAYLVLIPVGLALPRGEGSGEGKKGVAD